jgi:hypothetical protein
MYLVGPGRLRQYGWPYRPAVRTVVMAVAADPRPIRART